MKIKIITLCLMLSVLFIVSIPAFSQVNKEDKKLSERKVIQQKPMMRSQHQIMDMNKIGTMMDSSMTKCDVMMQQIKQMNVQNMIGNQMGINLMMSGLASNLKWMAEQMKSMTQNMNNLMANKEIMDNNGHAKKIKELNMMMERTAKNLDQMTDLNQTIISAMYK